MIAVEDVPRVPLGRLFAVAGLRLTPTLGAWGMPSPKASKRDRRSDPLALRVTRSGAWSDRRTGQRGDEPVGMIAYVAGINRFAMLRKLADLLQPGDALLNRCIRSGDTERAGPNEGEDLPVASTPTDTRLAKFAAARGTPRQRATALLQVAMNGAAADRRGWS